MENIELISFDCYGTLVDWESGILKSLGQILRQHSKNLSDEEILALYAELEPACEKGAFKPYREVLNEVVRQLGKRLNFVPSQDEIHSLAEGLKDWKPFPDTRDALKKLKRRFKLAVISNVDDDLFTATAAQLGIEFDFVVTALQVGDYKPSLRNFEFAFSKFGIEKKNWLHAAQSIYHDLAPADSLGIQTVWVNRRQGKESQGAVPASDFQPGRVVPDLKSLADFLLH